MHIQRLIVNSNYNSSGLFSDKILKDPLNFKNEFLKILQQADLSQDVALNGNAHCKEIIQNLWSLLDQENDTEKIVTHLQRFDQLVPRIFSDVVIED